MADIPTISITNPDLESEELNMTSPAPSRPGSPTVFDVVNSMEALDRDAMVEMSPDNVSTTSGSSSSSSSTTIDDEDNDNNEARSMSSPPPPPPAAVEENVHDFYRDKTVFLTGATGFLGKALLWKLLMLDVKKVFVLVRPSSLSTNASDRFYDEIMSNKAFVAMRRSMGPTLFDMTINDKICVIQGDLLQPALGIAGTERQMLVAQTQVILHCAALVDGNARLDMAVRVNVLGTLDLLQIADECKELAAFIHLSPIQMQFSSAFENHLFPVPAGDADNIVDGILTSRLEDLPAVLELFKAEYPDSYLLSKSLIEHVISKEVQKKKNRGGLHFPIAILRSSPFGPSISEPLVGWSDGINGFNGALLLMGQGKRIINPAHGNVPVDVIPIDLVVRMILGCAATIKPPKDDDYEIPTPALFADTNISRRSSVSSITTTSTIPIRDSAGSSADEVSISRSSTTTTTHHRISSKTTFQQEEEPLGTPTFPYIYHLTITNMRCLPWNSAYESMRLYWMRAIGIHLMTPQNYFAASALHIARARTIVATIRTAASSYVGVNGAIPPSSPIPTDKRTMHTLSTTSTGHWCHKASLQQSSIASLLYTSTTILDANALRLKRRLESSQLDPYSLVPEDVDNSFWRNYFVDASFGVHYYVCEEPKLRLPIPLSGWSCALLPYDARGNPAHRIIDKPAQSSVYTVDQVNKRMERMVIHVKHLLSDNERQRGKEDDEQWMNDMDDSLDDWCQDAAGFGSDRDLRMVLGKWRKKAGGNDDPVKIVILNDKRVNHAITQITRKAGVQRQTAVNEAIKILSRMSEKTQLYFVWFAGCFLKSLFDDMFESVRVQDENIRRIQAATLGKRCIYVPVTKSVLDPLLIWYICIRYHLPVPAFACDETLAQLGPLSDIYRVCGSYYIKRDKDQRSPLKTAVMAAYTQVLLREHGALTFCMERSRSRSGKYQLPHDDGFIHMIIESTLQSNQTRSSAMSRVAQAENTPPTSPDTPGSLYSPITMDSPSGNNGMARKINRDVFIVPINITYEKMPELPYLLDDLLDMRSTKRRGSGNLPPMPENVATSPNGLRPNDMHIQDGGQQHHDDKDGKFGRVLVGMGPLVSIQDAAEEYQRSSSGSFDDAADMAKLISNIQNQVQENQRKALIVSPVSLIASIILYGRATGGVSFGKMKDMAEWLRTEVLLRGYRIDWQEGEDINSVILHAFHLLDDSKNIIVEGSQVTDDTNIRVNDHADNVMTLSYYTNQIVDIFLPDAFFSVVYLSFTETTVAEDEFMDRLRFLVQLLEREFVVSWDIEQQFESLLGAYEERKVIRRRRRNSGDSSCDSCLYLEASMERNLVRYEQLIFMASLLYPTIDSYWIASCSLSAFDTVPMIPRSIVPLLSQWIATHLIAGRRTIYREVLSTESSRMAVEVFMALGFLTEIPAKDKLAPDTQISLHELGISTSETLIALANNDDNENNQQSSSSPPTPVSAGGSQDPETMMKILMAQIQMNRANSNMADLCQQIDAYRLGSISQRESFQNKLVFQKCLKQIKGILPQAKSRQRRGAGGAGGGIPEMEERMVQLVYALRTSSCSSSMDKGRSFRRISEAYSLRR